jgi:hypothetical protein
LLTSGKCGAFIGLAVVKVITVSALLGLIAVEVRNPDKKINNSTVVL